MAYTSDLKSDSEKNVGSNPTSRISRINSKSGREGGIVSGMSRREKVLKRYIQIAREHGIEHALAICRSESWKNGYGARIKHEIKDGKRQTNQANQTSK